MDRHFALAIASTWLATQANDKRVQHGLFPVGDLGALDNGCRVHLKYRDSNNALQIEDTSLVRLKESCFLKSEGLCGWGTYLETIGDTLLLFFEGGPSNARCIATRAPVELWEAMTSLDPPLRPAAYDLPPSGLTFVEAEEIYTAIHELVAGGDSELFGANAQQFLSSPHIIVPLFAHVLSLSSSENIDFPLVLKTAAEQLRGLLIDESAGPPRIKKIQRGHAKFWAEMLGERIAFLDGGVARISGIPSIEPLALRVGVYCVTPGELNLREREDWELVPYVIGDVVKRLDGYDEPPDNKRLQEASRYILEPLTGLDYLRRNTDVRFMFVHGPLVNQFAVYNEGEPNYLPVIEPQFLARYDIDEQAVTSLLTGIPKSSRGVLLWNQFMAVYGALMKQLFSCTIPIAGVVERTAGSWVAHAVLRELVAGRRTTEGYAQRIIGVIERFQISDDFLFGCILEEGEYLEPVEINKNPDRRAVPHWAEVVRQYPTPFATVLKTSSTGFPYRVEMNPAATSSSSTLLRLLYHTSRLLPRYAFPVGLDIVDKYAKVPDWLSRGVSARITADVLRRALNTGDPKVVAQVRQFLARTPRDFFYRPQI